MQNCNDQEEKKKLESVEEDDTEAKVSEGDKEDPVAEDPVAEDPVEEEEVKEIHKIDDDMKASLEDIDPWLANKLQQKEGEAEAEPEPENC